MIRVKIFKLFTIINGVIHLFSADFSLKNSLISFNVYKNFKISVTKLKRSQDKWVGKEHILFKGFSEK